MLKCKNIPVGDQIFKNQNGLILRTRFVSMQDICLSILFEQSGTTPLHFPMDPNISTVLSFLLYFGDESTGVQLPMKLVWTSLPVKSVIKAQVKSSLQTLRNEYPCAFCVNTTLSAQGEFQSCFKTELNQGFLMISTSSCNYIQACVSLIGFLVHVQ